MRIIYLFFFLFVCSCNKNKNLTPYLLSKKEFKFKLSYNDFVNSINFLFIVDDSGSMRFHKNHLARNAALFLEPLLEAYPWFNYNFALTSMGVSETTPFLFYFDFNSVKTKCSIDFRFSRKSNLGPFLSYSGAEDANYRSNVICAVASNIEAHRNLGSENFFKPIKYIAQKADKQLLSEFFGRDKMLILFFISDAGGEEYVNQLGGNKILIVDKMLNESLTGLKQLDLREKNIRAYSVTPPLHPVKDCGVDDTAKKGGYSPPEHVFSLVDKLRGLSLSICDKDWGRGLTNVSKNLLQSLSGQTVYLEDIPKKETMELFFNNKKVPEDSQTGWFLDVEKLAVYFGPDFDLSYYKTFSDDELDEVIIKYQPMNLDILQKSK